jgi:hypothetical protein
LKFCGKFFSLSTFSYAWQAGIDNDPDWPDPDRHALDVDPDPDLAK